MTIIRGGETPVDQQEGLLTERLSEAGGLTQFGAYRQTLPPGVRSSERHWHDRKDEIVFVLKGEAEQVDDNGANVDRAGD
ncbi:MAG: cupin domain-containing protein [Myxococcota bacterium]